jgi:TAG lipase/steryl ester hydrolase/phospholipase A2/LPA acyltransferase
MPIRLAHACSAIAEQQRAMRAAPDYAAWQVAASRLDALEGHNDWRTDPLSPDYEYAQIQHQLAALRRWHKQGNWTQLIYSLREGLQRNLGNLANPALYRHSRLGTKTLIEDYIAEVVGLLNELCDQDIPGMSPAQKLQFFRHTGQSFGRSSLMLSGGANMGWFHLGVAKTLLEHDLLPRVISGSSAGAVITAWLGTRRDSELAPLFRGEDVDRHFAQWLSPREMWRQKIGMDAEHLERFLRGNIGEYTFEEAFKKTKRFINISVSPVGSNQSPRLLNYLTTPHLLVWSAVKASCSLPGMFPPALLMRKDANGKLQPCMAPTRWVDGAVASDLPAQRLAELYNVNHHIVSQVNPHVIPFLTDAPQSPGLSHFLGGVVKDELRYRSKQALQLAAYGLQHWAIRAVLDGVHGVIDQKYHGDITLHPEAHWSDYHRVVSHLSREEFQARVHAGERATWPKLAMIRDQTLIGQMLEECIVRVKSKRVKREAEAA